MLRQNIRIGKIMGIPVGLDYSWFFIFAILTWMLAVSYFPVEFKGWSTGLYWAMGAATSLMLFVSVLLHELGHSFVALQFKLPVRSITLFLFGGVAQIAREPRSAWAEFWIAIAGPVVSFALGGLFYLLEPLVTFNEPLLALVKYLSYINLVLAIFNLVPGFPLDGGRVFRAIVWGITHDIRKATRIAATVGRVFAFIFIYLGAVQIFNGNIGNGLWIIFIGWFLDNAASAQVQQQEIRAALAGHKVAEAMNPNFAVVPADMSIADVMTHHVLGEGRRTVMVMQNDLPVGMLTLHHLKKVPRESWSEKMVSDVMILTAKFKTVTSEMELWNALEAMDRDGVNQLPVLDGSKLAGLLSRDDLISYLRSMNTPNAT